MSVFGNYARYYDLLNKDKDYEKEADYVHGLIQRYAPGSKTILDLGCGTGRHDFLLAEKGYSVTGIDMSEQMLSIANDPLSSITVNAQLPHRLSLICRTADARMIHISTDCVFDGLKGNYAENDHSNATDLYGRSKYLGEVTYPHCITLRTSIIGHELKGKLGLIEWFLAQNEKVRGYTNAIYTGFPTIELAHIN
jgi:hypothetical protein